MSRCLPTWGARALAFGLAWTTMGQMTTERAGQPPGEGDHAPPPRDATVRGDFRGGGPGGPMTERWLQRLQETSPEDHAKLREMRDRDPESFHREMRRRLREELGKKLAHEHPAIAQAIKELPDADREWLVGRLFGGEDRGPRGNGMGAGNGAGPEMGGGAVRRMDESDAEIWRLGRDLQQTQNEPARTRLKAQLREKLDQSFTRKHERRRVELDEMDAKVKEARAFLLEREKNRAAIIEQRIAELMSAPPPPPSGPGQPASPPPAGEPAGN